MNQAASYWSSVPYYPKCFSGIGGHGPPRTVLCGTPLVGLKGTKREILSAMHVKELIQRTILNGNHIFNVSGLLVK